MNKYELTIVLPGEASAAKQKSAKELIGKLVNAFKGKIADTNEWGKIDLAYPIKKQRTGIFFHFNLELEPESVKQVADKLRLENEFIRHLLVKVD